MWEKSADRPRLHLKSITLSLSFEKKDKQLLNIYVSTSKRGIREGKDKKIKRSCRVGRLREGWHEHWGPARLPHHGDNGRRLPGRPHLPVLWLGSASPPACCPLCCRLVGNQCLQVSGCRGQRPSCFSAGASEAHCPNLLWQQGEGSALRRWDRPQPFLLPDSQPVPLREAPRGLGTAGARPSPV